MTEASLKPGWTKVKFGEVVRLCKDRSSDPETDGIERYVGLEHLEPEDLRIRRWGLVAEGTTFTSRFKPGQVLFGKRRAYQRKIAVADFEGVCSGDIYVLESSDSKYLLPELLPFICQTDQFFEYAVGTSAGSLSPRTNWKQLQNFKLFLPALDEQYQILQFLQGIEKSIHSHEDTERCSKCLTSSILKNVLLPSKPDWKKYTLESILSRVIDYRGKTPPKMPSGIPLITAKNVRDGFISKDPQEFIPTEAYDSWMTRGLPESGDVLFTMEAPLGNVAFIPNYKFALAQRLVVLRAHKEIIYPQFLYWLMRSPRIKREVFKRATGTTAQGIKQSTLRKIPVFVPSLERQEEIFSALNQQLLAQKNIERRLESVRQFKLIALRKCFGGFYV
jgi:type I restriction enzyme S subunit